MHTSNICFHFIIMNIKCLIWGDGLEVSILDTRLGFVEGI